MSPSDVRDAFAVLGFEPSTAVVDRDRVEVGGWLETGDGRRRVLLFAGPRSRRSTSGA